MHELDKLEEYLKANGYEYDRKDVYDNGYSDRHIITVTKNGKYQWDVICQHGSYGYPRLLEAMGSPIVDGDEDDVEGYLTAETIISRLKLEKVRIEDNEVNNIFRENE